MECRPVTAMTEAEARLVVAGARYFATEGMSAITTAELAGETAPGSFITDARDTWYTARDLMRPDHEHVWIEETAMCDPALRAVCSRCGQRTDFEQ